MGRGRTVARIGYNSPLRAGVAQLVEQRIRNAKVEGSTPSTGTNKINGLGCCGGAARSNFRR
jgi:hypothetical protein